MEDDNINWSSEEMIQNANNWTLAGDVAIFNKLKTFSHTILSETESLHYKIENLLNNLEHVNLKLQLTRNQFHSLRNVQFIENRVYEDDETLDNVEEDKSPEIKTPVEDEENIVRNAISQGLNVMKKYYDKVEVSLSDSEDEENNKSFIFKPKDFYEDRPLPYLVGSEEWIKKWHVGLLPSDSESEVEQEDEEIYSSSDSEKLLPKNRTLSSETSSEFDLNSKYSGPGANSTFSESRKGFDSSENEENDEESSSNISPPIQELSSNEKFVQQLAAKLGDVINNETMEKTAQKVSQKSTYGDLFSDEPPPIDVLDNRVLPKSDRELFSDNNDIFAENNSTLLANKKSVEVVAESSKIKSKGLFYESDDDSSEEDMLSVIEKRKLLSGGVKNTFFNIQKTTLPFVDDQPPENTSPKKKPAGGVSIFSAANSDIFSENQSVKEVKINNKNEELKKSSSIFNESSEEEDMFTSKIKGKILEDEKNIEAIENSISLKDETEKSTKKISLFDDDDDDDLLKEEEDIFSSSALNINKTSLKPTKGLFDDSEESGTEIDQKDFLNKSEFINSENENKEQSSIIINETVSTVNKKPDIIEEKNTIQRQISVETEVEQEKPKKQINKIFNNSDDDEEDLFQPDNSKKIDLEPQNLSSSISLFDPNPPPLDWDALSDKNSIESDSLSITEAILDRNNQNQPRNSGVFDEAPPSLDTSISDSLFKPEEIEIKLASSSELGEDSKNFAFQFKAMPGKLKSNLLNINVGALLPGAAASKLRQSSKISSPLSEDDDSLKISAEVSVISQSKSFSGGFGDLGETDGVLQSVTKDRAKIPVKRRPSTRKARQEAVRKSMGDFTFYEESAKANDEVINEKSDLISQDFPVKKIESVEIVCTVEDNFAKVKNAEENLLPEKTLPSTVEEEFLSKDKTVKKTLFESLENSSSSDDELFASTKLMKKPIKPSKSTLFSDKSDSEDEVNLFAAKVPSQPKKRTNIFDDSGDSDDDLFGGPSKNPIKPPEIRKATIKKLENTEVTDFDPLSQF